MTRLPAGRSKLLRRQARAILARRPALLAFEGEAESLNAFSAHGIRIATNYVVYAMSH